MKSWSYAKESDVETWTYLVLPDSWSPVVTFSTGRANFLQDATFTNVAIVYWCAEDSETTGQVSTENGPVWFTLGIGKLTWYATAILTDDVWRTVHISYAFYHPIEIKEACDSTNEMMGRYTVGYADETIYSVEFGDLNSVSKNFYYI